MCSRVTVLTLISAILVTSDISANNVIPLHYNIRLEPIFENLSLKGYVTITVNLQVATDILTINAKNFNINEIKIIKDVDVINFNNYTLDSDKEFLNIYFDNSLELGIYEVSIDYEGKLSEKNEGFYVVNYTKTDEIRQFAMANFYDLKARQTFPCFDSFTFLSTFSISIVRPKNYTSISNGFKIEEVSLGEKVVDTFSRTDIMPIHLLSFAVIDFPVNTKQFSVHNYLGEDAEMLLDLSAITTERLMQLYNLRLNKIDQIVVPDYALQYNLIATPGLIIYRSSSVLFKDTQGTTEERQQILNTVTLAFAKQYVFSFSENLNVWLREGRVRFHQYEILSYVQPQWRMSEQFIVENVQRVLEEEIQDPIKLITEAESFSSFFLNENNLFSVKALAILRMLTNYERPGDFSEINGEMINYSWAEMSGYPIISVGRNYSHGVMTLEQESATVDEVELWKVPLNFATKDDSNFNEATFTYVLENKNQELMDTHPASWVIVNKQQNGYYRVNYDITNWKLITDYLKSDNFSTIHPINRAQLIDDAFSLVKHGYLNISTYLELIGYIDRETDYIPLMSFFKTVRRMKILLSKSPLQDNFKIYVNNLLENLYDALGVNIKPFESHLNRLARIKLLTTLCSFGHEKCLNEMYRELESHKNFHPDMEESIHCGGMYLGKISNFLFTYARYEKMQKERFLKGMACTNDATLLNDYLLALIDKSSIQLLIQPHQKMYAFMSIIDGSDAGVDLAIEVLKKNVDAFFEEFSIQDISEILISISNYVVTEEQKAEIEDFIDCLPDEKRNLLSTVITGVLENVNENSKWLNKNIDTIENWLNNEFSSSTSSSTTTTTTTTPTTTTTTTTPTTTTTTPTTTTTTTTKTTSSTTSTTTTTDSASNITHFFNLSLITFYLLIVMYI